MPFIKSIASRIFGLAIILVCLMIALAGSLLWRVTFLESELQHITGYYVPLAERLDDLNEAGLRRRVAFERWYGALGTTADRKAAIAQASADYEKYTTQINADLGEAKEQLANPPPGATQELQLKRIHTALDEINATFLTLTTRQRDIIRLVTEGHAARAADIMSVLDDLQSTLQNQRREVQKVVNAVLAEVTSATSLQHKEVFWTTVLATLISVLLGLSVAALVTRRLVQPVRSLMTGIQSAEKGDFSVQLPVNTADEIGALTQSFNFFIGEMRLKEELRNTFGKYIDPRILDRLIVDPSSTEAAGGRQEMAVSFADLVGFTDIGEHLTPAAVVNLLNRHFTLQAEAIQQQHGVVDKFMGDAIMAFWGAPFTQNEDHALLACHGALLQAQAITRLQASLSEITGLRKNIPHLDVRIGISTGEVIVGNIGSESTRSYTVIGDTVNLASRLEQANRFYDTRILICGATREAAGSAIVARELDTIIVKGKTETTSIFELLGYPADIPDRTMELCEKFSSALEAYRQQDWDAAEKGFRECRAINPSDRPAQLF
ncbi:MAG: adenylate/guanylate cyclase domain-containing protein, partial [Chthoniobacterales bacterium]